MPPSWSLTIVLPLCLVATWCGSLMLIGEPAQYAPFALIALVIMSLFCVGLIKRNENLILFLLFAAVILISLTFRVRKSGEVGLDFQNGYKMAIWGICMLLYACNFQRTLKYFKDPIFLLFGVFLISNVLSSIWSPVPLITFAGSIGTIAYFALALVLTETIGERRTIRAILWCLFIYCIINLLAGIASPETAWYLTDPATQIYRFMGLSGQPNTLSRNCSIYLIFILCAYSRSYIDAKMAIGLGLLALFLIMLTESRTPIASLMIALLLIGSRKLPNTVLIPLGLFTVVAILFVWFSGLLEMILGMVGRDGNADEALTMAGRTELWSWVWDEIAKHPIIGHGYNSFESYAGDNYPVGADKGIVRITHNAYLDALYSTGIIGATFFVMPLLLLIYRWWTRPNFGRDLAAWSVIIVGITEVELPGVSILPPLMLFLLLAFDAKEYRLCNR